MRFLRKRQVSHVASEGRGPLRSDASRSPLASATHFRIPSTLARATLDVLIEAGQQGAEAFVLWGGAIDNGRVDFRSAFVPSQLAHATDQGLLVTVDGEALFAANKSLFERGEVLAGQVHSHPTEAFHSSTDDCFSLVTLVGALSIVIPDFGRGGLEAVSDWAFYRLVGQGQWNGLDPTDRVEITGDI